MGYDYKVEGLEDGFVNYTIYLDGDVTEEKYKEICNAIHDFRKPYEEKDIYIGHLKTSKECDKIEICLDFDDVENQYLGIAIDSILRVLDNIPDIKSVVANEGLDFFKEEEIMDYEKEEIMDYEDEMDFDLTKSMGLDKLGLYYSIKADGIEGECFNYSIYLDGDVTEEKCNEIGKAISDYFKPYDEKEIYTGYLNISKKDDKIFIYLDLGNVKPQYEDVSINGILQALNNVSGIKSVIINEGLYDF